MRYRSSLLSWFFVVILSLGLVTGCKPSNQQLEKAIGDYMQKNPPALQKAIQDALKVQRPQRPPELSLDEKIKRAIKVDLNNAPTLGSDNAPVTIVEFSDFQCPFCGRVEPTLKQLLKDNAGKIRLAFRNNPLPFHQNAASAAKASMAAKDQGKYWQMHDALFENQKDLSEDAIRKIAKDVGLNMGKFEKDWKSNKYDDSIAKDMDFARSNGASGTPSFFINGVLLTGAQPIQSFQQLIDKLLQPAAPAAGGAQTKPAS